MTWQELPKLKILKPRINGSRQLVYAISPCEAGKTYEELLDIAVTYDDYDDFLTEHCLRFTSKAGQPVVDTFNPDIHTRAYPGILKDLPLILGFDFGGTNPAYGIFQQDAGRLIIHKTDKPSRKEGFEVTLDAICERLKTEFRDPLSEFYNTKDWKYILIGDHSGTYENNQGTSKASEILYKHFGVKMQSNQMTQQLATHALALVKEVFSKNNLVVVNPHCRTTINVLREDWHYPENVDKHLHPRPEPDGYAIHIGDVIKYVIWYFFRREEYKVPPTKPNEYSFAYE